VDERNLIQFALFFLMTFSFLEIGVASKETVPELHDDNFNNHSCMPFVSFISIPSFVAQCCMWAPSVSTRQAQGAGMALVLLWSWMGVLGCQLSASS
jgi:hypothetical protein